MSKSTFEKHFWWICVHVQNNANIISRTLSKERMSGTHPSSPPPPPIVWMRNGGQQLNEMINKMMNGCCKQAV